MFTGARRARQGGLRGRGRSDSFPASGRGAERMIVDKGDTAWMLVSTILVLMMILPGLALFYGGLVRSKNMLSILSQALGITAVAILVWVGWGYALAFGSSANFFLG